MFCKKTAVVTSQSSPLGHCLNIPEGWGLFSLLQGPLAQPAWHIPGTDRHSPAHPGATVSFPAPGLLIRAGHVGLPSFIRFVVAVGSPPQGERKIKEIHPSKYIRPVEMWHQLTKMPPKLVMLLRLPSGPHCSSVPHFTQIPRAQRERRGGKREKSLTRLLKIILVTVENCWQLQPRHLSSCHVASNPSLLEASLEMSWPQYQSPTRRLGGDLFLEIQPREYPA